MRLVSHPLVLTTSHPVGDAVLTRSPASSPLLDILLSSQAAPGRSSKAYSKLVGTIELRHGIQPIFPLSLPTRSLDEIDSLTISSFLESEQSTREIQCALRLVFIGWIHGYRGLYNFTISDQVEKLIYDTEVSRLLNAYPDIGARVALMYIFNEGSRGYVERGLNDCSTL